MWLIKCPYILKKKKERILTKIIHPCVYSQSSNEKSHHHLPDQPASHITILHRPTSQQICHKAGTVQSAKKSSKNKLKWVILIEVSKRHANWQLIRTTVNGKSIKNDDDVERIVNKII